MKKVIKENLIDVSVVAVIIAIWCLLPVLGMIIFGLYVGSKLRPTNYFDGFMAIYFLLVCAYCVAAAMDKVSWFYYLN